MVEAHPVNEEYIEPDAELDVFPILIQNGQFDQVRSIEGLQGFADLSEELRCDKNAIIKGLESIGVSRCDIHLEENQSRDDMTQLLKSLSAKVRKRW